MALYAMAIPIPKEKYKVWLAFVEQLRGPRRAEFRASRERVGVHERTFLQHTPTGDVVIVTLEGDEPATAFQRMAAAKDDFTRWFLQQVKEVHGIDLSAPPPGPLPELIADSAK